MLKRFIYVSITSHQCLRASAKLQKATVNVIMSACLSFGMEQLGFHGKDFHEIWYLRSSRKPVEKIKILLKYDENNGHLHDGRIT